MATSVEKLRDSLESVPGLSKTALAKEIASVVRLSQGTARASWKSEKQPNWWRSNDDVSVDGVTITVPKFQAVKQLTTNGIKAALCMFYQSRIHFELHVRDSASEAILSDSNDGNNPFPPEHYGPIEAEKEDMVQQDEQPHDAMEDVQSIEDENEAQEESKEPLDSRKKAGDKSKRVNPSQKQSDDASEGESEDENLSNVDELHVDALDEFVAKLRLGDPLKFVDAMHVKLKHVIEAEANSDCWTPENEKYKLMVAFHSCTAQLMFDVSALRRAVEEKSVEDATALQDKCEQCLSNFSEMLLATGGHESDSEGVLSNENQKQEATDEGDVMEIQDTPGARTSSRRPRRPPSPAPSFKTPVTDTSRDRRAAAASRALQEGTPSRQAKENEELYDANGNRVDVLFSSKGSPIYITQATAKPRRARRARLPPSSQTTSTTGNVRRSKRNKP